jgi:CheY-like chemotaxis protein
MTFGSDPPDSRILVVEPQAIIALDLQRILGEAGYRVVGPAPSVAATGRLLERVRIDCAVLDLESDVEDFSTVADLLARASVPFVVLGSGRRLAPGLLADRPIVEKPYMPGDVLTAVRNAIVGQGGAGERGMARLGRPPPGERRRPGGRSSL